MAWRARCEGETQGEGFTGLSRSPHPEVDGGGAGVQSRRWEESRKLNLSLSLSLARTHKLGVPLICINLLAAEKSLAAGREGTRCNDKGGSNILTIVVPLRDFLSGK